MARLSRLGSLGKLCLGRQGSRAPVGFASPVVGAGSVVAVESCLVVLGRVVPSQVQSWQSGLVESGPVRYCHGSL